MNAEQRRLDDIHTRTSPWRRRGPYLSDRQWGTVREDYSRTGDAWRYFPHMSAPSRAYRWGEDGIGGFSDDQQLLCWSVALWNHRDPILKERLFGLANEEGNHGEDVKEAYFHLDATPTHSYGRMLYKYPQREFPYARLVEENASRNRSQPEFELRDAGVFDDDRYFDVFVEHAKADTDDILFRVTVANRGPEAADVQVLLQLWFRNTWAWDDSPRPRLSPIDARTVKVGHPTLPPMRYHLDGRPAVVFCENDTNAPRLFGDETARGPFKDGFHDRIVAGRPDAVTDEGGTKGAGWYSLHVPAGGEVVLRARLSAAETGVPFADFDDIFTRRIAEADAFYAHLQKDIADADARLVQRQALAGLLWSKQFYLYDVARWADGDPAQIAPPTERRRGRNADWRHFNAGNILSMPDKWEYPWFAAWDTAFHMIPMAMIDAEFAKRQMVLLTREWYMHPNGQMPAYEWDFSDVNPPVHAWATWRIFQMDRKQRGDDGDLDFLERVFHKLLLNFTWWVNRKDAHGLNIFQGGFLGMDNVGVFDRNMMLPDGSRLDQADGTSWVAMFSLNMMRIALELAMHRGIYQDIATKFFMHFLQIAEAMTHMGGDEDAAGLWDADDGFYYDRVALADGRTVPLKLRSMVGLVPLFAVEIIEPRCLFKLPEFEKRLEWVLANRPELASLVSRWTQPGCGELRLLSLLRGHRMKLLLRRVLDETEFLGDYGVRSMSRVYKDRPYSVELGGQRLEVKYLPAESDSGIFGGNSNWRGPIWFPVNFLLIESLHKFHYYYGDDFLVEYPTGSGKRLTLLQIADELSRRLTRIFLRDEKGRCAVFGGDAKAQNDPHWRDYVLFHEYFCGDSGKGAGASHQTGWTALVAKLLQPRG